VFEETSNSLSYLQGTPSFSVLPPRDDEDASRLVVLGELSSLTREMCLVVLRHLSDLTNKDATPWLNVGTPNAWARIVGVRVVESLERRMGRHPSEESLYDLAKQLCANTAKPMVEEASTTSEEWVAQLTGDNLRWESIGLLFTFSEIVSATGGELPRYRSPYSGEASKCVGLCIELVRLFADGNIMLLYLCLRRNIMESMRVGDAGGSLNFVTVPCSLFSCLSSDVKEQTRLRLLARARRVHLAADIHGPPRRSAYQRANLHGRTTRPHLRPHLHH
jgi:hypothetical protein